MSRRGEVLDPWLLPGDVQPGEEELLHRVRWFIRVRWLFVAGLCVAIAAASRLFVVEFPLAWAAGVAAVICVYNGAFCVYHRFFARRRTPDLHRTRIEA